MCEECRYAHQEVLRGIISRARPEQILRLLRDIRRSRPDLGRDDGTPPGEPS